jgi:enoyl-CoA hydratase/carnithine racemase
LIAVDDARLGLPEVTLPVVPGMEGCHWLLRKADRKHWPEVFRLLLEGRPVKAPDAAGWLVDFSGPLPDALRTAWGIARGDAHGLPDRPVVADAIKDAVQAIPKLSASGSPLMEAGRKAIVDTVRDACGAKLTEALDIQAKHSGAFMAGPACGRGMIGTTYKKTVKI